MIDVQTRPIFLEGPGETFNWIFCGLYLYVSISQLLKNSVWLGLKLLRGRSLITLSKFWPSSTTYITHPQLTLTKEFLHCYRRQNIHLVPELFDNHRVRCMSGWSFLPPLYATYQPRNLHQVLSNSPSDIYVV